MSLRPAALSPGGDRVRPARGGSAAGGRRKWRSRAMQQRSSSAREGWDASAEPSAASHTRCCTRLTGRSWSFRNRRPSDRHVRRPGDGARDALGCRFWSSRPSARLSTWACLRSRDSTRPGAVVGRGPALAHSAGLRGRVVRRLRRAVPRCVRARRIAARVARELRHHDGGRRGHPSLGAGGAGRDRAHGMGSVPRGNAKAELARRLTTFYVALYGSSCSRWWSWEAGCGLGSFRTGTGGRHTGPGAIRRRGDRRGPCARAAPGRPRASRPRSDPWPRARRNGQAGSPPPGRRSPAACGEP